jgi:Asp-tRNA(Asn)/Glu-tRNA(Gln) amidotransferase A subunit family amidase
MLMDISDLTAVDVLAAFKRGDIRVSEYVEVLLERCRRYRDLNAFIYQDPAGIRDAAVRADRARDTGEALRSLHGLPIILKDNIDTSEMPTTAGTPALKDHRPLEDAPIVKTLIEAGAIIFGKANMHELAHGITNNNKAFGPVRNPHDPGKIPGGSSGGCGAAVAARLVPVGIGTDTGGSVRIPAALCGIVGFRPTVGRYPQKGIVPISHTRDTAGPMTRSVDDAALIDRVITGDLVDITPTDLHGVRLGVPRSPFFHDIDPAVSDVMESVLDRFRSYGIQLVEIDLTEVTELDRVSGFPIALYEVVEDLEQYLRQHEIGLDIHDIAAQVASPDVKVIFERLLNKGGTSKETYLEALHTHRRHLQDLYRECFTKSRLSAIVFPTTPLPAISIGEDDTTILNGQTVSTFGTFIRNTSPASVAGIPGLSLPAGTSPEGLPVGMEIEGPFGNDRQILAIGMAIEEAERHHSTRII